MNGIDFKSILKPQATQRKRKPAPLLGDTLRLKRQTRHRFTDNRQVQTAAAQLQELPGLGESLHCIMSGSYHGWSLIPAFLSLIRPAKLQRLTLTTLGFSARNGEHLLEMIDAGDIQAVTLLCSCYFRDASKEVYEPLRSALAARGQTLCAARCHAKITLMETTDGRQFVIESSANLRSCQSIEQFTLTQAPDLHAFHLAWIMDVIAKA